MKDIYEILKALDEHFNDGTNLRNEIKKAIGHHKLGMINSAVSREIKNPTKKLEVLSQVLNSDKKLDVYDPTSYNLRSKPKEKVD